ncbi:MAG: tripartite tricarboxylate transporter substrate binding protein [Xanthobacteraceae bacterium]|nr:tripartite tricarboxylate transporter substrate binding protein [Xanthobacteraceae bacterium]
MSWNTRRDVLGLGWGGALSLALPNIARAAEEYPSKPIKIIVAASAGGPTDVPARLASQILAPKFGQPVVVENRPGAGGALGARVVATSPPDGYTLLAGNTSTLAAIPAVSVSAGYDPVKDFAPIVRITEGFQVLVVHPDSPWKTLKSFIDYAKANPGKINYGHTGPGGLPNLAGEIFMLRSGTKLAAISYRSGGESSTAVLSKAVDATFENIAILRGLIQQGKLRALAVQNKARTPLLPDVPTMAEAGVPDCEANTFFGLVAPAGTPAAIIKRISDTMNAGLASEEIQKSITALGSEAKANSPQEFAAYIAAQHKKWVEVGKAAGVRINDA